MNELEMKIVELVIAVVIALCGRYAVPYFKTLMTNAKFAKVVEYIKLAVKAAEKLYDESGKGAEKKAYVLNFVSGVLLKMNIKITDDEINTLIESAVEDLDLLKK